MANQNIREFKLKITADSVDSTDERFTMDDLGLGDNYKPLDAYFERANGEIIRRNYDFGERKSSNQTLPRIACQVFEKQIADLSVEEKEKFPVCRYKLNNSVITGIYSSVDEYKKYRNTRENMIYRCGDGMQFVFYCWNTFSTIIFVQECLKRFGDDEDRFVLIYREKDEKKTEQTEEPPEETEQPNEYRNPYSKMLIESKNIIFRGAPGTGKSYLAKEIAADIVSKGKVEKYSELNDEQKKQVDFVQFHPSYDYTDFVEGLRPRINKDGSMGFELQDGVFKKFADCARKNLEDSKKSKKDIENEATAHELMEEFFSAVKFEEDKFKTVNGSEFFITDVDDKYIYISIPGNASANKLRLNISEVRKMLESGKSFEKIKDIWYFFGRKFRRQDDSYCFALYKKIKERKGAAPKTVARTEGLKKYIFIIDEINRGEISKIFGELFFSIDPGYRGRDGEVSTQYANLHENPDDKFYIPENLYIIGTMNDIDRSVDSFDFAMRRRFRFIELKADENLEMLAHLEDEELRAEAIRRMKALNREILNVDDLNENYQIGAAYFLRLKTLSFDQLWIDCLKPLLQDYIQGMYDEEGIMKRLKRAYDSGKADVGDADETAQD